MIYLKLFLTFLKIGAVSFGGGYGMIPLIREEVLSNGWLAEDVFVNYLAVSESTPGPIAINMATFVGSSQAGLLGAFAATFGVVLPSFIIILIIASVIKNLLKFAGVKALLGGIKPAVIGLILATAVSMILSSILCLSTVKDAISFDYKGLIIFGIIVGVSLTFYKLKKKTLSPIILILISAVLGMVLYAI